MNDSMSDDAAGHETPDDGADESVAVADFASSGPSVGAVPVHISYGIIERFSEGLYSSPNKTFEELITNSYDAGADTVWVYLPDDLTSTEASLIVIDNGESMNLDGLRDLWRIGESRKRSQNPPPGRKYPVGKFGIGKLATYVLARELTYIVHREGKYLAVTMDYGRVSETHEMLAGVRLALDVVELDAEQAKAAVRTTLSVSRGTGDFEVLHFLDGDKSNHWTAAILTNLKPTAQNIELGRLRWVMRTALPLNPQFRLFLNDSPVASSKADAAVAWTFRVGSDEQKLVRNADSPWGPGESVTNYQASTGESSLTALRLPKAGIVWGEAKLYEQPLERGKSEDLGRSHGFFVRVRGRLINLDDEDFSLGPELRHGTLTRFRMEVNADDLDDQVASARENLKESPALTELKNYLLAIFNKARGVSIEQDHQDRITKLSKSGRLSDPPTALSQGPLRRMLQRAGGGDAEVQESLGLRSEDSHTVNSLLSNNEDLLESVLLEAKEVDSPLVTYDPSRRAAIINQSHPFINNYIGAQQVAEPLKLFGLSELLTQAYMLDENIPLESVLRVIRRRDSFLRALANRYPRSAHVIARQLRDASNNEDALEDAVGDALELLGFDVLRLGGSTHGTDGVATARLGLRGEPTSESYAFTYDAKSTKNSVKVALGLGGEEHTTSPGKIRADTARTSILRVHRERAEGAHNLAVRPLFTLLVAPDFQGAAEENGLINAVCKNDDITAIRVDDLARLVELFALQGLNPLDLRSLFDVRLPDETRKWVDDQSASARVPKPPVATLVECLVKYSEAKRPTTKDALGAYLAAAGTDLRSDEIDALVRGLAALAPKSIYSDERVVALNSSPAALYAEIRASLDEYDTDLVQDYLDTVPGTSS